MTDLTAWFSETVAELYEKDENYAVVGTDFGIDPQGNSRKGRDTAEDPFFSFVDKTLFERPTYRTFVALLDNYVSGVGVDESVSVEERTENIAFINAVCDTEVMKHAFVKAQEENFIDGNYDNWKRMLYAIWFKMYARSYQTERSGIADSSAFEHTFVGETKESGPIGFHNWIRFYLLEKSGELNYKGYVKRAERSAMCQLRFSWGDADGDGEEEEKVSSFFLGTSPEFEMAVYTLAALIGQREEKSDLELGFVVYEEEYKVQLYLKSKFSRKQQKKKFRLESSFPTIDWSK